MSSIKSIKKICLAGLIISLFLPIISLAQSSDNQTIGQTIESNGYIFSAPSSISFTTIFLRPDEDTQVQKVLDPTVELEQLKFTDFRGSESGSAFQIYAYASNLSNAERTSIDASNIGIASTTASLTYPVDYSANNFLEESQETVTGPLDTNSESLTSRDFTFFTNNLEGILIMDGTLGVTESGRTGAYSLAPAVMINIPENTYGNFTGTMTFELILP